MLSHLAGGRVSGYEWPMTESCRASHESRLAERRKEAAELEARVSRIAWARLAVATAIVGGVCVAVWGPVWVGWWSVGVLAVGFVALLGAHTRAFDALARRRAAVLFHERALARMTDQWRTFDNMGDRWRAPEHPFSDDLDIFGKASLFQLLDQTFTAYGEETLAYSLMGNRQQSDGDSAWHLEVQERQAAVAELAGAMPMRERFAVEGGLFPGAKPDPRGFSAWASTTDVALPGSLRWVGVAVPLGAAAVGFCVVSGWLPGFALLAAFVLCHFMSLRLRPRLVPILGQASAREAGLARYAGILGVVEQHAFEAPLLERLRAALRNGDRSATRALASLSRIVSFHEAQNNEAFRFFVSPLLMWDFWCAFALDRWRMQSGRHAPQWFSTLAELESLVSLAAFAYERPEYSFPRMGATSLIKASALGHPLLGTDACVRNDVEIEGPGFAWVVTGSNMSGKSTLLRAIGINVVLANAGAPVCAASFELGSLTVATSMRVADSLADGTSRFFAELKKLERVVSLARASKKKVSSGAVLFLLDEILHGTNARERLVGARAIVRELLRHGALGAVSTHDLALGDLASELPGHVRNVHFEEQVSGDVMTFDYRVRDGIVQSSNALRLMAAVGLDVFDGLAL